MTEENSSIVQLLGHTISTLYSQAAQFQKAVIVLDTLKSDRQPRPNIRDGALENSYVT